MGCFACGALACALAAASTTPAAAWRAAAECGAGDRPVIAEVFYDAEGDDSGREFVELFDRAGSGMSLAGARLEVGDGSGPGRWTARWSGSAGDSIAPLGRFVIGGGQVTPPPDAVASLDLQNGPDAIRIVWPDGVTEVVGYGVHEFPEYACGAPAPDVPAGWSLARVPDDARAGSNALDFRAARPSPGRANQARWDAALARGTLVLDPEMPAAHAPVRVRFAVVNAGAAVLRAGSALAGAALGGGPLASRVLDRPLAPAETAWVALELNAGEPRRDTLAARVVAEGDEDPTNDADSLRVRVGPCPLAPTEVQFHPAPGESEWIEVRNEGAEPLDLADFRVGDRAGAGGSVRGGPAVCAPGSLAVVVQDRVRFLVRYPGLDTTRVWEVRPWGALNNSDGDDGFADEVVVRDRDGAPCGRMPYRASGVPAGVPIERGVDGIWSPAYEPAGTPLAPPRVLAPIARPIEVAPRRVGTGGAVRVGWALPWPDAEIDVVVYDLIGRRVAIALSAGGAPARGERTWRPAGLVPGAYVLVLTGRSRSGATVTAATALRIEGVEP